MPMSLRVFIGYAYLVTFNLCRTADARINARHVRGATQKCEWSREQLFSVCRFSTAVETSIIHRVRSRSCHAFFEGWRFEIVITTWTLCPAVISACRHSKRFHVLVHWLPLDERSRVIFHTVQIRKIMKRLSATWLDCSIAESGQ